MKITSEKTEEICQMYKDGLIIREIAEKLDISTNTVNRVLHENNVEIRSRKRFADMTAEEMYKILSENSFYEVNKKYGKNSYPIMLQRVKNAGYSNPRRSNTFANTVDREEFAEFYRNHRIEETAEKYGISENKVYATAAKLKITKERGSYRLSYRRRNVGSDNLIQVREEIIRSLSDKYSCKDLAIIFGLTEARVCQIVK